MSDKSFEAFNEQVQDFFSPMRKLNSLMLDNMERMTEYQLEAMKRYSQLGTERLRDASEIKDTEGMRDFGTRQAEMMTELSNQMLEDARAMSEMSLRFKSELEALYGEAGQAASERMEEATGGAKAAPAKARSQASRKSS